jgi:hypothetical protein
MDKIKCELQTHLTAKYGAGSKLELETHNGLCIKMFIQRHPQYIIYMREDGKGEEVHCYYVHRQDLADVTCHLKEIQSYREQFIQQLLRQFKGSTKDFVEIGKRYVFDASWRMDGFTATGGSRKSSMVETFDNMKWFHKNVPEPRLPREKTEDEIRLEKEEAARAAWKKRQGPPTKLQLKIMQYKKMRLNRPATGAVKRVV